MTFSFLRKQAKCMTGMVTMWWRDTVKGVVLLADRKPKDAVTAMLRTATVSRESYT